MTYGSSPFIARAKLVTNEYHFIPIKSVGDLIFVVPDLGHDKKGCVLVVRPWCKWANKFCPLTYIADEEFSNSSSS